MLFEARLRAVAVRYASVDAGFRVRAAHGRARTSPRTRAEKATDGADGSGYTNRHTSILAFDLPFLEARSVSSSLPGIRIGVLDVERRGGIRNDASRALAGTGEIRPVLRR